MLIGLHFTHLITNRTNPLPMAVKAALNSVIKTTFNLAFIVIFVVNLYNVIILYMKDYKERRTNEKVIP